MTAKFPLVAGGTLIAAVTVGLIAGRLRPTVNPAPAPTPAAVAVSPARVAVLYQTACANCHGPDGRGDGPSAAGLRPAPRDFAARPWRRDRTPESARRVIADGLPGTAMPAGKAAFSPAELDALAAHVLALGDARPAVAVAPPADEAVAAAAGFAPAAGVPPPLTVADAAGNTTRLADLRGKLVLVHFWGTDCPHCLKEFPALHAVETRLAGRGLVVLHVCTDGDAKEGDAVAAKVAPGVRAVSDARGTAVAAFEVQTLPTAWLVSPAGEVVAKSTGATDWAAPAAAALLEYWLPPKN